ncbi:tetratricopeptide repeat protein [Ekhidna sp.]|uniref:tetratricopeptide repeat protein n=1 Tax=Ekhidna sp. TaxID=2608089 RepID=UPI003C7BC065
MVKSSIYFLSLVLLSGLISCSEREWYKRTFTAEEMKQLSPQLRGGRVYYYQGSVPEQFQLKEAFKMDSTDADLWREFGTARVKRGILDEMYHYYGEAVKRKPEVWAGFRGYLYLYFYRDYERAVADFNLGDEANGQVDYSQGQSHDYMRGICYYGLKDYTTAIDFLDRYINKVMEEEGESWVDVYAILYKGLSLMQLNRLDDAMTEFDRVLKYYTNLSDCFYHKARIYISRGQFDLALKELDQAEEYFKTGYFHQRPYVEVLEQIYLQDIQELGKEISMI